MMRRAESVIGGLAGLHFSVRPREGGDPDFLWQPCAHHSKKSGFPLFAGMSGRSMSLRAYHLLVDGAENRVALRVQHLDAHAVAELEERSLRRAVPDGLDRAELGDAGIADAALGDRPAG